jgi:4-amino-4-deoxy-L-arabinose transferase-like glycosyltransferase
MLNRSAKMDSIVIFICGLIFFTIGLNRQEIIGFESRFYLFALEMWRHGPSWFPTTYGAPYPDYPATSMVLIYLTALLSGTLNKLTAVFPSALAAALTLAFTYLLGALHARRFGWYAAGFLLFTLTFLAEARTISLDMYVTLFTTLCFFTIYTVKLQQKSPRFVLLSLMLMMSFAMRGPIGLIIPAGVICIFYLIEKEIKHFLQISLFASVLLILSSTVLFLIAYHVGGLHFMQQVMRMEVFGRLQEYQTPASYFYFLESIGSFAVTYPLAILVLIGTIPKFYQPEASPQIKFLRVLLGWVLVIMIGLSIPADKKIRYILPIAPALALICAYLFMGATSSRYFRGLKAIFYYVCWILPLLGLGALSVLYHHQVELHYLILAPLLIVLQMLIVLTHNQDLTFFFAVFAFILCYFFMVETINQSSNQALSFANSVEKQRALQHAGLAFYREGSDGLAIKYVADMQEEERPLFITDLDSLPADPLFIITKETNFSKLPESQRKLVKVILRGKIGHQPVVVFSISAAHPEAEF